MVDENIIRDVTDEIFGDIRTCGVMNGSRPREDCSISCRYRDICDKIFGMETEHKEMMEDG